MKIDLKFAVGQRIYHILSTAGSAYSIRSGIIDSVVIKEIGIYYIISDFMVKENELFATAEGADEFCEKKVKNKANEPMNDRIEGGERVCLKK